MSRISPLLGSIVLASACTCSATAVATAGTPNQPLPIAAAATHVARAETNGHRSKRAHTNCRVVTKRHRKHARHCAKPHNTHAHTGATAAAQPSKSSSHTATRASIQPHAKHNDRSSTVVSVNVPNPAAIIASVLATPCQDTELMPEAANLSQIDAAIVCLVNQERARNNELPLQLSTQLAQSSQMHSERMVDEDYFSHVAPNGETPLQRIQATGYIPNSQVGYTIGENIAWGTLSLAMPNAIVAAWIASPEHLANILNSEYRDTAVGVDPAAPASLAEGQPGAVYTEEFGVITV